MSNKGRLFLIPNVIADNTQNDTLNPKLLRSIENIRHFLVEDVRTARRYLSSLKIFPSIESLIFFVLDKNTKADEMPEFFRPIFEGNDVGVVSESGCPGVADPGALAVAYAHSNNIQVVPLVGPSSILLALMASGLNGQKFAFHGYLPIEAKESLKVIHELETESRNKHQTQIFIETPYRNNQLLQKLIKTLSIETRLTVAIDLTGDTEQIITRKIADWKVQAIEIPKKPAIFLFLA